MTPQQPRKVESGKMTTPRVEVGVAETFVMKVEKDPNSPGKVRTNKPGEGCFLRQGDSSEAVLETTGPNGFSGSVKLLRVDFFERKDKSPGDEFQSVKAVGGQLTDIAYKGKQLFTLKIANDLRSSVFTRDEITETTEHVWYSLIIDDKGTGYVLDPELLNTGNLENRRGYAQLQPGDEDPTL